MRKGNLFSAAQEAFAKVAKDGAVAARSSCVFIVDDKEFGFIAANSLNA
jgi:hypothetical protein